MEKTIKKTKILEIKSTEIREEKREREREYSKLCLSVCVKNGLGKNEKLRIDINEK